MDRSSSHPRKNSGEDGSRGIGLDGSFELFRRFVEHLMATNASEASQNASTAIVDWEFIRASVAGSCSVEQAIGRAAVIADRMSRGTFEHATPAMTPLPRPNEDPFFAFSVADAVPDFGDNRRYRERVIRRVGRLPRLARGW